MAALIIQTGKHRGKKLRLAEKEILIGRDHDCQIRLAHEDISRRHCTLLQRPEGVVVRDLGSRNGTFVNDAPIHVETELKPGDLLRVGPVVFELAGARKGGGPKSKATKKTATENDIADWLSDDDTSVAQRSSDTTIIKAAPKDAEAKPPAPPEPEEPPKPQFRSLAEEAKDIIRRHWETVRGGTGESAEGAGSAE
jgi:pSer/pThr/pTyr-binding forkhead associated (FHA) protein